MHHNTDLMEERGMHMRSLQNVHVFGVNENIFSLLAVSDLMISDYSGAIFDGYYCRRPIILLNVPSALENEKINSSSLEITQREKIACMVSSPEDMDKFDLLAQEAKSKVGGELWNKLFTPCSGNNAQKAANVIRNAAVGKYTLSSEQLRLRNCAKTMSYREFK